MLIDTILQSNQELKNNCHEMTNASKINLLNQRVGIAQGSWRIM
jgi:hypothetical protein